MNDKLIEQQQQQIKNLSDEITLMRMKYEGIRSIYNRQHLQSKLDKANEKIMRYEETLNFYAKPTNYYQRNDDHITGYPPEIMNDRGWQAKKALDQSS